MISAISASILLWANVSEASCLGEWKKIELKDNKRGHQIQMVITKKQKTVNYHVDRLKVTGLTHSGNDLDKKWKTLSFQATTLTRVAAERFNNSKFKITFPRSMFADNKNFKQIKKILFGTKQTKKTLLETIYGGKKSEEIENFTLVFSGERCSLTCKKNGKIDLVYNNCVPVCNEEPCKKLIQALVPKADEDETEDDNADDLGSTSEGGSGSTSGGSICGGSTCGGRCNSDTEEKDNSMTPPPANVSGGTAADTNDIDNAGYGGDDGSSGLSLVDDTGINQYMQWFSHQLTKKCDKDAQQYAEKSRAQCGERGQKIPPLKVPGSDGKDEEDDASDSSSILSDTFMSPGWDELLKRRRLIERLDRTDC